MNRLILILFLIPFTLSAQDTTRMVRSWDGSSSFFVEHNQHLSQVFLYPGGRKEAEVSFESELPEGPARAWYPDGKPQWRKFFHQGKLNGTAIYFDKQGQRAAELVYENDQLTDTVFIRDDIHLLLGSVTFSSRVIGGMQREDGSANISESSGKYAHCPLQICRYDSLKRAELLERFRTDWRGDFFLVLRSGNYVLFPDALNLADTEPGQFQIPPEFNNSGSVTWDETPPVRLGKETKLFRVSLHSSSTGYAP